MPSVSKFISVLKAPTGASDLQLKIRSVNRSPSEASTVTVTGPLSGKSEGELAEIIKDAVNARLTTDGRIYTGIPSFDYQGIPPFDLRARVTDHVVQVWGQSQFAIDVLSSPDNMILSVEDLPAFITIAKAKKLGPLVGTKLVKNNGTAYTDDEVQALIEIGSQEMLSVTHGHFIMAAQYLHEERGFNTAGTTLSYTPILEHDHPVARTPQTAALAISTGNPTLLNYHLDFATGELTFPEFTFPMIPFGHPLDYDNILKLTYVAGTNGIHPLLARETIRVAGYVKLPETIEELKAGTTTIKYKKNRDAILESARVKMEGILGL